MYLTYYSNYIQIAPSEKLTSLQSVQKSCLLWNPQVSLPRSREPTNAHYPQGDEFKPHYHITFLKKQF
jgi:hypothetical protein